MTLIRKDSTCAGDGEGQLAWPDTEKRKATGDWNPPLPSSPESYFEERAGERIVRSPVFWIQLERPAFSRIVSWHCNTIHALERYSTAISAIRKSQRWLRCVRLSLYRGNTSPSARLSHCPELALNLSRSGIARSSMFLPSCHKMTGGRNAIALRQWR